MLDHETANELLGSPAIAGSEECRQPWNIPRLRHDHHGKLKLHRYVDTGIQRGLWEKPLMRIWDENSGSQPEADGSLVARNSRARLDTFEARKASLTCHADNSNWEHATPYISFSSDDEDIERHAGIRGYHGRTRQQLTVISPFVRFVLGLPIVSALAEMRHYNVADPYQKSHSYYSREWLCLWEVTPEEIVGQWDWDELSRNPLWYFEEVLPAYNRHRTAYLRANGRRQPTANVAVNIMVLTRIPS